MFRHAHVQPDRPVWVDARGRRRARSEAYAVKLTRRPVSVSQFRRKFNPYRARISFHDRGRNDPHPASAARGRGGAVPPGAGYPCRAGKITTCGCLWWARGKGRNTWPHLHCRTHPPRPLLRCSLLHRLSCCRGLCFGRPRLCRLIKRARSWKTLVLPKAPCPKLLLLRCEGLPPY